MSESKLDELMAKLKSVSDWSRAINASWKNTTEGMLRTAKLCYKAQNKYSRDICEQLKRELFFSAPTFSKLVQIGGDARLYEDPIKSLLPPAYPTAYAIHLQKQEVLDAAMGDGILRPGLSLADFNKWLAERSGTAREEEKFYKTILLVPIDEKFDDGKIETFVKKLGCEWKPPKRGIESEPEVERAHAALVKSAKQALKDHKTETLRKAGNNPEARKKAWPYEDKQVAITDKLNWKEISSVFATVGIAEVFGHILDQILLLHPVADDIVVHMDPRRNEESWRIRDESLPDILKKRVKKIPEEVLDTWKLK